jgi:hypothetical protein
VIELSLEMVQLIIGRAVASGEFREALLADPDGFLSERGVIGDEAAAIKAIDWSAVGSVGSELEQRVSRFGITRATGTCH